MAANRTARNCFLSRRETAWSRTLHQSEGWLRGAASMSLPVESSLITGEMSRWPQCQHHPSLPPIWPPQTPLLMQLGPCLSSGDEPKLPLSPPLKGVNIAQYTVGRNLTQTALVRAGHANLSKHWKRLKFMRIQ